jgi:hypothetical protein
MAIDNEEAVQEHIREQRRQGFRYYTNPGQSGNQRYINVKYQGGPACTGLKTKSGNFFFAAKGLKTF